MCFGLFEKPKAPDIPAPPPLPEVKPPIKQTKRAFGLQALRARAALAGRKSTIKTSPLGVVAPLRVTGKKLLGE